jgi:acyl carrier protein
VVRGAASTCDGPAPVGEFVSLVLKVVCPELLWTVVDDTLQILGGRGYIETNEIPRFLRDARVLRIFEGPTESLRAHLGSLALSRRTDLRAVIEDELGDRNGADVLFTMIDDVVTAFAQRPPDDTVERTRLLHDRLGSVVAAGLVDALVRRVVEPDADRSGAREWAARRLRQACRLATEHPVMLDASRLLEVAAAEVSRAQKLAARGPGVRVDVDALVAGRDGAGRARLGSPADSPAPIPAADAERPGDRGGGERTRPAVAAEGDATPWRMWLTGWVAKRADVDVGQVEDAASLQRYGIDSVAISELVSDLYDDHGVEMPSALVWENPTIKALAQSIAEFLTRAPSRTTEAK